MNSKKYRLCKVIACLSGTLFALSACALDSESIMPSKVCLISILILTASCYLAGWFEEEYGGRDEAKDEE